MLCDSERLCLLVFGLCLGEMLPDLEGAGGPVLDLTRGRPVSLSWSGIDWFRWIAPVTSAKKKMES